jgi:hypothetical protein
VAWAWWSLTMAQAGEYRVEVYVDPAWEGFDRAHYVGQAAGRQDEGWVEQGAVSGWVTLGEWDFAAGGDQFVAVYDDGGSADSGAGLAAPLGEPIPQAGCAQSSTAPLESRAVWLVVLGLALRRREPAGSPGRGRGSPAR